ncbi:MAG: hypothetical protein K9N09_10825 [Candidatus Cloacimonetes bacterium]|nr:hypothetical protein [Candidatus Cloacimonadota bacterium]MCF7869179.1 hypothetical protein [Candidatus Cloacimonadota bacterium]
MKNFILLLVILGCFFTLNSITLADLDFDEQIVVKDFVIGLDDDITEANVEMLEGSEYNVIYEDSGYIIIEKDGYYYIVPKE